MAIHDSIRTFLLEYVARVARVAPDELDTTVSFFSLGFTSLDAVNLARALSDAAGSEISPTAAWDYPTIDLLAAHGAGCAPVRDVSIADALVPQEAIAIVGIGCRFPGANGPDAFFDLLCRGDDPLTDVPADRWPGDDYVSADIAAPAKMVSRRGGFLTGLDTFDAAFFRMSPREAAHLDPRQRLMLEIAWEALEDAGLPPLQLGGSDTGVFVATLASNYGSLLFDRHLELVDAYSGTGNGNSVTANRLSYFFDLRGPSLAIDTACSGSLVATHLACRSLLGRETSLALAGGVNVILKPDDSVFFSKTGALSPDGVCRVFDRRANGIVRSEGAGCVVLKRLAEALRDGDRVYAVIHATAVNQDGATNGLMAPNGRAQQQLLRRAYDAARIDPSRVQYVEAHGTGTALGDPIEVGALMAVLGRDRDATRRCAIGSAKSNIGHTEAAAGMAGVIKTALAIHRRSIPANAHFEELNPLIPFEDTPFFVQHRTSAWPHPDEPLVAGVSAFGFAGTNAHVVLGEAPPVRATPHDERGDPAILVLSARSESSLRALANAYADAFEQRRQVSVADLCRAAATRRSHLEQRFAAVGGSGEALASALRAFAADGTTGAATACGSARLDREPRIAFLFSGQGSHWAGMGRRLYARHASFRRTIDACDALFTEWTGRSLVAELARPSSESRLHQTEVGQPAIFAVQAALCTLFADYGLRPAAVLGQSLGEAAAAFAAGALTLDDAFRIVFARSRLMKRFSGTGRTAAVSMPPDDVRAEAARRDGLSIAGTLTARLTLVSGPTATIDRFLGDLAARDIFARALPVDVALHGPQMESLRDEMLADLQSLAPRATAVPFVSSVTASEVAGASLGADYWYRNLREPYAFDAAFARLREMGCTHFVELSPHPMLRSAVAALLDGTAGQACIGSLRRDTDETASVLEAVGALYCAGAAIAWTAVFGGRGRVIDLPHYQWSRERYWFDQLIEDGAPASNGRAMAPPTRDADAAHPLLGRPVRVSLPTRARIWETRVSRDAAGVFADHGVQGAVVLPGAAYVELALAALRAVEPDAASLRVEALTFRSPLLLTDERVLQTTIEPGGASARVRIASATPDGSDWTIHAEGRCSAGSPPRPAGGVVSPSTSVAGMASLPVADHYDHLGRLGLTYGPRFRPIRAIWQSPGSAIGLIERSGEAGSRWLCDPTLLDGCLQLAAAALADGSEELRLPAGIEAFELRSPLPARFWCRAEAPSGAAHSPLRVVADLTLLDDDGVVLASANGVAFDRVGAGTTGTRENLRRWFYEVAWLPADAAPSPLPPPERALARFDRGAAGLATELELAHYAAQWPAFDRLSLAYVVEALATLGVPLRIGARLNPASVAGDARILPRHWRFLHRLLEILREEGILAEDWSVSRPPPSESPRAIGAEIRARFPNARAELGLVERGGSRLADVLRGEVDPLEILFAYHGDDLLERLYRDSVFTRYYNAAIRDAVLTAADSLPPDRRLRILEVGAGTGATTQHVLPALGERAFEYVFSDISPRFLEAARQKFAASPGVSYRVLDLETPDASDPAAGGFDIVIAANVLHATANLDASLASVRRYLAPGGWLLLLESPGRQRWLDLIVGGTDGWWRFQDDRRTDYPLLSPDEWRLALESNGFEVAPPVLDPTPQPPQFVMLATASAPRRAASRFRWLLVDDGSDVGRQVTGALAASGAETRSIASSEVSSPAVVAAIAEPGPPWRVLHLAALSAPQASELSLERLDAVERRVNYGAIELLQTLAHVSAAARVWFVTGGAQPAGPPLPLAIAQAPLWGIGRVAANEHPELVAGLIDLDPAPSADHGGRLLDEVLSNSPDGQVALRGETRLVARLVRPTLPTPSAEWSLRSDAAYLVTGGLRGIGLAVAGRMVERGARHLVLLSRTELPPRRTWRTLAADDPRREVVEAVRTLEALGAEVIVGCVDVGSGALEGFLRAYEDEGRPPIRGVVHSAGLIDDRLIVQTTREALARVTHPKVRGGWLLHEAFRERALDFFVLFSSGTSLLGTFGQANYASGNTFLDALAHHRRALGLPATAINWGVWGRIGIVARRGREQQLADNGLIEIRPELGLDALEYVLAAGVPQVAALPTDWSAWRHAHPGFERLRFFDAVRDDDAKTAGPASAAPTLDALDALRNARPEARDAAALAYAVAVAAAAFRLPAARVDPDAPLPSLGLDSIMAIEIRNRIEGDVGASLSIVELLQGATVRQLASRICAGGAGGSSSPAVAARQGGTAQPSVESAGIPRLGDRSGPLPCTVAQEALWSIEAFNEARAPVYNVAVVARLKGRLDPGTLRAALEQVVARHEPLRTGFRDLDGRPWQTISRESGVDLRAEDLARAGGDEDALAECAVQDLARRPFDLRAASLARFLLLNGRDRAWFGLSVHHLVFDGWSAGVLVRELAACYESLAAGRAPALAPLPIAFADYAAWTRAEVNRPRVEADLAFWQHRLGRLWEPIDLPIDAARPARPSFRGAKAYLALDAALSDAVRGLAHTSGATPFMVFAAALGVVLHVDSHQRHIVIGTTPSQRDRRDIEGLIGYFVNMLPLPLDVEPADSFALTLARTRQSAFDAFAHQSAPLDRIQQALRGARARRTPAVQVVLTLQNAPMQLPAVVEDYRTIDNGTAKFDLVLNLVEQPSGYDGWWEYASDLFHPETIDRFSVRLRDVLGLVTIDPEVTIDGLRARVGTSAPTASLHTEHFQFPAPVSSRSVDHERSGV